MRMSALLLPALFAAACHSPKPVDPNAPRPDDVAQVLTCCVVVDAEGTPVYSTVPEAQCPEDLRNPLDTCDIGPGDVARKQ